MKEAETVLYFKTILKEITHQCVLPQIALLFYIQVSQGACFTHYDLCTEGVKRGKPESYRVLSVCSEV